MDRESARRLLGKYVKSEGMIAHSLASEAVMRALALRLGEDVEQWGLAGLLHDLDVEMTANDAAQHGLVSVQLLSDYDIDEAVINAILMHNEAASGQVRTQLFEHALAAGETITGLIIATTLVYPDKKLLGVKPKSITKRMKERKFAASVSRENIMECEKLGLSVQEFALLALEAMQAIHDELGL